MSYWGMSYDEYENELYRQERLREYEDYEYERADNDYYEARYVNDEYY